MHIHDLSHGVSVLALVKDSVSEKRMQNHSHYVYMAFFRKNGGKFMNF